MGNRQPAQAETRNMESKEKVVGRAQARRFSTPAQYVTDAKPLPHPTARRNRRPSSSSHQHQHQQQQQQHRQHRKVGPWPTIAPHWQAVQCINVITGRCIEHSSDHTVVGQGSTLLAPTRLVRTTVGRISRRRHAPWISNRASCIKKWCMTLRSCTLQQRMRLTAFKPAFRIQQDSAQPPPNPANKHQQQPIFETTNTASPPLAAHAHV